MKAAQQAFWIVDFAMVHPRVGTLGRDQRPFTHIRRAADAASLTLDTSHIHRFSTTPSYPVVGVLNTPSIRRGPTAGSRSRLGDKGVTH
jgi:hypothetical protein